VYVYYLVFFEVGYDGLPRHSPNTDSLHRIVRNDEYRERYVISLCVAEFVWKNIPRKLNGLLEIVGRRYIHHFAVETVCDDFWALAVHDV
jgi:hypothetical protein